MVTSHTGKKIKPYGLIFHAHLGRAQPVLASAQSLPDIQSSAGREYVCSFYHEAVGENPSGHIHTLCKKGRLHEALQVLEFMVKRQIWIPVDSLNFILKSCIENKDLFVGRQVHRLIIQDEYRWNLTLGCLLIRMYAASGNLLETLVVFNSFHKQNVYTWTAIILAHAQHGQGEQAISLYNQMQQTSVKPSSYTFVAVLKACASLRLSLGQARMLHADISKQGLESDVFVRNALVDMYANCGSVQEARQVFDKFLAREVVLWNSIIAGYAKNGQNLEALLLSEKMQQEGQEPNVFTFTCLLKVCANIASLDQGRLFYDDVLKRGLESDVFIASAVIDLYTKCDSLSDAHKVFNQLRAQDVVLWSAMIEGYAKRGHIEKAFQLFEEMQVEGIKPNRVTFLGILKACSRMDFLDETKLVHTCLLKQGLESDLYVGSTLVDIYAKCGHLEEARKVFDKLTELDVVTWNTIIGGYVEHGHGHEALQLFRKMQKQGKEPDKVTFIYALKACAIISAVGQGKCIHDIVQKRGFDSDLLIGSALVAMYAKCGMVENAHKIFDKLPLRDDVLWSTMIDGYAEHGFLQEALLLLEQMQENGIEPTEVTFGCILKACANSRDLHHGKLIHAHIKKHGIHADLCIGNTLIDMYCKCGSLVDAYEVFNKLPLRDVVTWSAMIVGCAEHADGEQALQLFQEMQEEGTEPNFVTIVGILKASSGIAALGLGKQVHVDIIKTGLDSDLFVGSALVDMYAKCGNLDDASRVFGNLEVRDMVSWNAMIVGYGNHGYFLLAHAYVLSMQQEGIKPNVVTFVGLLSACSHGGLVQEARYFFKCISETYGITPTIHHYICMVDVLCRVGRVDEAEDFVLKMPFQPDAVVWMVLLASCAKCSNLALGRRVFNCLVELEFVNHAAYVLMSKIYTANLMWEDLKKIKQAIGNFEGVN